MYTLRCGGCCSDVTINTSKGKVVSWIFMRNTGAPTMLIQDAFPELNKDEREMILSGICAKCYEFEFSEVSMIDKILEAL
jgi:hypothetical protein